MKKSELKALLKIIVQEVVAAKKAQLNETKGLSGFKKSSDSTEHTEKVADSKDLTGGAPKEKEEGKKLPVVKKPSTPQKVGSIKEEIINMIREAIAETDLTEMARVKGAVGAKFKVKDPSSPTGWVVKGHKTIPDGTPTEAPKGPYVPKGDNPNLGRPKKVDVGSDEEADDDEAAPEATGAEANSTISVTLDGDNIGELDLAKIKGSVFGYLGSMLRARNYVLKLDPAVKAKLDEFSDMWVDGTLPIGVSLDLQLGDDSIKLV